MIRCEIAFENRTDYQLEALGAYAVYVLRIPEAQVRGVVRGQRRNARGEWIVAPVAVRIELDLDTPGTVETIDKLLLFDRTCPASE